MQPRRDRLAAASCQFQLLVDDLADGGKLRRLRDHRNHHVQIAAVGSADQGPQLRAQQRRAVERHADAAPAESRILFRDGLHVGQHLVAADIESAEDDGLAARARQDVAVDLGLVVEARERRRHHELELGTEETDAVSARFLEMGHLDLEARVDQQLDAAAIARDGGLADERPVLALAAGTEARLALVGRHDLGCRAYVDLT